MADRVRALIIKDNKLLLFKRFKNNRHYYSVIGGGIDKGESEAEALFREVKEETNLEFTKFKYLGEVLNSYNNQKLSVYLINDPIGELKLGGPEIKRSSSENIYEFKWIEFSELKNLSILPPELGKFIVNYFEQK